jgi:hypothetical protein
VSKLNLTLATLVAAIPAGFLGYLMIMTFLNLANQMTTGLVVLASVTLAAAVCVVLMPVLIPIFGKQPALATGTPVDVEPKSAADDEDEGDVGLVDEDPFDEDMVSEGDISVDDLELDDDFETDADGDDELYAEDDDVDGFEIEVFDDEDD